MVQNFFTKLFSLFAPSTDPEVVNKKRMRQIARELSRSRFARFYKPKTREIRGDLGAFFYDIYKVIAPVQILLQNASKSAVFKQVTVEYFLDKDIEKINEILNGSLEDWIKIGDIPVITQTINEKLAAFSAVFNADLVNTINRCYNNIISMVHFTGFDFFGLLKKFNGEIRERDFSGIPTFRNVYGPQLIEKIKDFIEVAFVGEIDQNWEQIIAIMKQYRNDAVMLDYKQWSKILNRIHDVYISGVMEQMVRHISNDPFWQLKPWFPNEHMVQEYLEAKQTTVKGQLDKITSLRKNTQKKSLVIDVFGKTDLNRAQFYTVNAGEFYIKKKFEGFTHAEAFNYLFAFLTDVFAPEIGELCNMILIRGGWVMREFNLEMSDNYHQLTELAEEINAFDIEFSDFGSYGSRLRSSFSKLGHSNSKLQSVASILNTANKEAQELIDTGIKLIIGIGRNLNSLLDDRRNTTHNLIRNWQELDNPANPITECMAAAYTKINTFIRLMLSLTTGDATTPGADIP